MTPSAPHTLTWLAPSPPLPPLLASHHGAIIDLARMSGAKFAHTHTHLQAYSHGTVHSTTHAHSRTRMDAV
jgi:hypothetical protein